MTLYDDICSNAEQLQKDLENCLPAFPTDRELNSNQGEYFLLFALAKFNARDIELEKA